MNTYFDKNILFLFFLRVSVIFKILVGMYLRFWHPGHD